MALVPACNREREVAASQTFAADPSVPGVVTSGAGVAVGPAEAGSEISVSVGETTAVAGGEVEEGVGVAGGSEILRL